MKLNGFPLKGRNYILEKCRAHKGISLLLVLSLLGLLYSDMIYFFHLSGIEYNTGDMVNYRLMYDSNKLDIVHWSLISLMQIFGFGPTLAYILFLGIPIALLFYVRSPFKVLVYLVYSPLIIYIQTGLFSELLAFMFFIFLITAKKNKWIFEILSAICHPAFISCIFLYNVGIKKWKKAFLMLIIGLIVLSISYKSFKHYSILNLGISSNSYVEPTYSFVLMFLLMPLFITFKPKEPFIYWIFIIYGLIGHNGRMALYATPFILKEWDGVKNKRLAISWGIIVLFLSLIGPFAQVL